MDINNPAGLSEADLLVMDLRTQFTDTMEQIDSTEKCITDAFAKLSALQTDRMALFASLTEARHNSRLFDDQQIIESLLTAKKETHDE